MKKLIVFLLALSVLTSGCIIKFNSNKDAAGVAGVFKSFDKGDNWVQKNLFLHSGGVGSIANVNVVNLNFDPSDNRAIYLCSEANGLFYSYDSADSWQKIRQIGDGRLNTVAIDSINKCVIYASFANTILKTVDCGRTWSEIYIDTRIDKTITALAVDSYDNLIVYAGNTAGDILKSVNGGGEWQVVARFESVIKKIMIDPTDTKIIYVPTQKKGIIKTTNGGSEWKEINDGLKQYSGSFEYKNLIFDKSTKDSLLLVAKYGLLKTTDGGDTWEPIPLITPPATTDIYSVAMNPKNNLEIYYTTKSTFYKTTDGGKTWITKKLPSSASPAYMEVDPQNENVVYLGFFNPPKK